MNYKITLFKAAKRLIFLNLWIFQIAQTFKAVMVLGPLGQFYADYCHRSIRSRLKTNSHALCSEFDTGVAVNAIKAQGYANCATLSSKYVNGILKFCRQHKKLRHYNPHENCALVHSICYNEKILSVVRSYLGAEPIVLNSLMWWLLPPSQTAIDLPIPLDDWNRDVPGKTPEIRAYDDHKFHFDIIDFRSLTLFIYLTDVDHRSAPHSVIEGTAHANNISKLFHRVLTDEDAQRKYRNRIRTILGPEGTMFFEELSGYHKVAVPEKPRLALRINYTLQRQLANLPPSEELEP